ncbi:MAG: bifunctional (p)ppGpp synthetase/guanosine-3',5'-bis(diphosphate) 3'-pyrophosphohydrolase [Planctomycetes bacterium]|nr:bifunctional (p)ppGpp synthetase/guanosine-3',5'-bis(diphosphate) 3'-pyrophosphohydrolase [Planctomycetota bacterium]
MEQYRNLLEAAAFAARAHRGQLRKDGETPYVSHVFRVCLIVRDLFGIVDQRVLTAALLHDTVEDTTTDFDDIEERFGKDIARWVALLSKDKRLPEAERERAYMEQLAGAEWEVKVMKLADMFDNLMDMRHLSAEKQGQVLTRLRLYLECLRCDPPEETRRPLELVGRLFDEVRTAIQSGGLR